MTTIDDLLRKLYMGCGLEGDMIQLSILLRKLSKEYFAQEATDEDVQGALGKICKVIVAHMASCNKQYSPDQCVKDFYNAIIMSPPDNVFQDLRKQIGKKKKSNTQSGSSIL